MHYKFPIYIKALELGVTPTYVQPGVIWLSQQIGGADFQSFSVKTRAFEYEFILNRQMSLIFLRLDGTNEIAIVDGKILTQEQLQKSIKAIPFYEAEPYAVNDCEAYLINLFGPKVA